MVRRFLAELLMTDNSFIPCRSTIMADALKLSKKPTGRANLFVSVVTSCCFVMTTVVACHQFAPLAKKWWNAPRHCQCQECRDAAVRLQRIERELLGAPSKTPSERPPVTPLPPIAPPIIQMPAI